MDNNSASLGEIARNDNLGSIFYLLIVTNDSSSLAEWIICLPIFDYITNLFLLIYLTRVYKSKANDQERLVSLFEM